MSRLAWTDPAPLEVERPRLPWWTLLPRKFLLAVSPIIAVVVVVMVVVFVARRVWRYPLGAISSTIPGRPGCGLLVVGLRRGARRAGDNGWSLDLGTPRFLQADRGAAGALGVAPRAGLCLALAAGDAVLGVDQTHRAPSTSHALPHPALGPG